MRILGEIALGAIVVIVLVVVAGADVLLSMIREALHRGDHD